MDIKTAMLASLTKLKTDILLIREMYPEGTELYVKASDCIGKVDTIEKICGSMDEGLIPDVYECVDPTISIAGIMLCERYIDMYKKNATASRGMLTNMFLLLVELEEDSYELSLK